MRHFSAKQYLVSLSSTRVELRFVKRYRLGQDFLWNFRIHMVCTDCVSNTEVKQAQCNLGEWRISMEFGILAFLVVYYNMYVRSSQKQTRLSKPSIDGAPLVLFTRQIKRT